MNIIKSIYRVKELYSTLRQDNSWKDICKTQNKSIMVELVIMTLKTRWSYALKTKMKLVYILKQLINCVMLSYLKGRMFCLRKNIIRI
jgi:hypothetical protein